jgi:hypothetical protein
MSNVTATIVHPNLHLAVAGRLQKMKVGDEINLDSKTAESLGGKVLIASAKEKIEVGKTAVKK